MDRTVWKRLLEHAPTEILINYVELSGIKVKGFRKTSTIPRPVMITQLTQPQNLTKLRDRLDQLRQENDQDFTDWTISSFEEIMQEIEADKGKNPVPILLQLFSNHDPAVLEKANRVWEAVDSRLEELVNRETAGTEPVPQSEEAPKESATVTKRLQKTIEKMKETHDRQRAEWNEQRKALHEDLANLRQKVKDQQALETESEKLRSANSQLTQEKQKLQEKLNAKQAQINNLTQEISKLNEQIKVNQNQEVAASAEAIPVRPVNSQPPERPVTKTPIILIGELSRQNRELTSNRYDIRLMDAAEFEQMLQDNQLDPAIPVWMLNYEMEMRSRRRIRRSLETHRVQEFKTFHEIKDSLK